MRGLILAILLTLVGSEQFNYEPVFSESKTYVYNYEGFILNRLPVSGLACAGFKLNCKVEISRFALKTYLFKIIAPELKEYNGIWPKDPFTRSTKLTEALTSQLCRTIMFEYSEGHVGAIYVPEDVSETVVNIQRGIINLLQVTVMKNQNVYDLQEDGITGVCHTRYVIQDDKRTDQTIAVKSRDLDNCQEKVEKNIGTAYLEMHNSFQKNIRRATTYTYKMNNSDSDALITEATALQVFQFSPFNELDGAVVMEARQGLFLLETKSGQASTPQVLLHNRGGLRYRFAAEQLQMPILLLKTRSPETQIAETLQHLVQNNQHQVQADAPAKFLQLVQILRTSKMAAMAAIWKQFAGRLQHRWWLLNAISVLGTLNSLKFVQQCIQNQELNHHEAIQTAALALQYTRADHHTMRTATEMVTDANIRKSPPLYKVTVLAYGSMVNKYCCELTECPEDALAPLHHLASEAATSGHEEDMSLVLKALGNAGQPASIKHILKFLPGFSSSAPQLPARIQTDAVMALRNPAKKDPNKVGNTEECTGNKSNNVASAIEIVEAHHKMDAAREVTKVREIALQVFMNRRVRTEVRMMACVVLFETKPDLAVVATVANIASKESKKNLQLASFVYSHMKALSISRVPQLQDVAASCSLALKILNPKLDALSYRYSKAIRVDMYKESLMAGASIDFFMLNSATATIPVFLLSKIRGFLPYAETEILEVAIRAEGLEHILRKQNISFAEYPMRKKIMQVTKTLLGWKALPPEVPLLSANFKLFGQEQEFCSLNKETIHSVVKALTEPIACHSLVKTIINKALKGVAGQRVQPVLVAEVRHIVPTCVGLPIEFSLHSAAVANAAIKAVMKVTPPLSPDFCASQLLESNIQIHTDLTPSVSVHTIATMGINTRRIQAGIELHAKLRTNAPMKFTAKVDMKTQNIKLETTPCQQENELFVASTQVFAVTRNIEDLDATKKIPVLPQCSQPNILKKRFESIGRSSVEAASRRAASSELMLKKCANSEDGTDRHPFGGNLYEFDSCTKSTNFGFQICLESRSNNADFLENAALYELIGESEAKIVVKPVHTDAAIKKLLLEIQAGPRAASKIISMVTLEENEVEELEDSVVQMKLKKILGIDEENWNSGRKNDHDGHLWSNNLSGGSQQNDRNGNSREAKERRPKRRRSSSSDDDSRSGNSGVSSSSSSNRHSPNRMVHPEVYEYRFRPANRHVKPRERTLRHKSASKSSSSRSSSSGSILKGSHRKKPAFLGDSKPPVLAITAQAIRNNCKKQGYQLIAYADYYSSKPQLQTYVVDIANSSRWRACANAVTENSHEAKASLKWGRNCQDYRISAKAETGYFGSQPGLRLKLEWPKIPSNLKVLVKWVFQYIPGAALMVGFSQERQNNPSRQAKMILSLNSPRTLDALFQIPQHTLYYRSVPLPMAISAGRPAKASDFQAPTWDVFSEVPFLLMDKLKGRCTASQNRITTFNGVKFNYSMPGSCYHILAQDCSPEMNFLVMMKTTEESPEQKAINVKLGSHDVEMFPMAGSLKLVINGIKTRMDSLPYQSHSVPYIMINQEGAGLSLTAPDYGIEKLYYDGAICTVGTTLWMKGKTCGVCGHHDDEKEQEFQMPDGSVAKDAVSFAHSWVISGEDCAGACKLHRTPVKLEKPLGLDGEDANCYSVDPVLRCMEGCTATATTPVSVGFHCHKADSSADLAGGQMRLKKKDEDFSDIVAAHTACTCDALQCADQGQ